MPPVDHIAEVAKRMPRFACGTGRRDEPGYVSLVVRFNGLDRQVWLADDGVRPPAPGGAWLDDRVSAACRLLFEQDRGRARAVAGLDGCLEFRVAWPEPPLEKVHASPAFTIHPCPKFPAGHRTLLNVRTAAIAGADQESVILANGQQYAEFRLGPGVVRWAPHRPSELEYTAGAGGTCPEVRFRHTVIRDGGRGADLVTPVSPAVAKSWPGVVAAVEANCKRLFGPGRLRYEPELGETFFTFGE